MLKKKKNLPVTADDLKELSILLDFLQRKDITTSERDKSARLREEPVVRWSTTNPVPGCIPSSCRQ
jgi:hypothetical protein